MPGYIGVVHQEGKSSYGVSFPDFPGCVTAGKDLIDLHRLAKEALVFHIAGMREDGESLPAPTSYEHISTDPAFADAKAFISVQVKGALARAVRVNITIPDNMLVKIDKAAKKRGVNRSSFLVQAALKELSARR